MVISLGLKAFWKDLKNFKNQSEFRI